MQKNTIYAQSVLIDGLRTFFKDDHFLDILTPPAVKNPGMETHIHPFQLTHAKTNHLSSWYLQTSPEFHMKELLSHGLEKIFTISYSFRDEPNSEHHRPQFIMLEWYRAHAHYTQIMKDCENLFSFSLDYLQKHKLQINQKLVNISYEKCTIQELFLDLLKVDILNFLDTKELKCLIENQFPDVPLPVMGEVLSWDDYYFLLFLNKVEPKLKHYPYLLLYEFPHHLAALSTLKKDNPKVAERFEIYCGGLELCNAFNELTDLKIQKERFEIQKNEKKNLYQYELPQPDILYSSLSRGLPPSAGIALGVERFLKILTDIENPFWA